MSPPVIIGPPILPKLAKEKPALSQAEHRLVKMRGFCRRILQNILEPILEAQTNHIEDSLCESAGIVRQSLSLDEESEDRPIFFRRYEGVLLDLSEPDDTTWKYNPESDTCGNAYCLREAVDAYISQHEPDGVPGSYSCSWDSLGSPDLFEATKRFQWTASSCASPVTNPDSYSWRRPAEGPNPPLPHAKCVIHCAVDGNGQLLRAEIYAIIMIMKGRLRAKALRPHLTAPVMLLSAMGPYHFRVLEAYFTGEKLIIRNTPLYDMRVEDTATVVLEAVNLWWHGGVVENTEEIYFEKKPL